MNPSPKLGLPCIKCLPGNPIKFPIFLMQKTGSTRVQRFTNSLLSGYGATCVAVLYSLLSIPLAISYLSTDRFGMWALILQSSTYLAMGDLGVSNAIGRLLMPYITERPTVAYGQIFTAGLISFIAQGIIVLGIGFLLALVGPSLFQIGTQWSDDFFYLMLLQSLIVFISFPFKCITFTFIAHARYDWINIAGATGLAFSLIALFLGFHSGLGIYSFILATAVDCLISNSLLISAAAKSGILPKKNELKWPTVAQMILLWKVGRDFFLSCIGSKLLYTSQSFLLARFAGLESVAVWVVGSKMFFLIRDLVGKASQMAGPLLIEMYVAKMYEKAGMRLSQAALGIGYLATFASGLLILANPVFVQIWTNGKLVWPQYVDALLAIILVAGILQTTIGHSIAMTMNLEKFRWISIKEALAFIALSCLVIPIYGIAGMVAVQAACTLIISTRFIFNSYEKFVKEHDIPFPFSWSTCWKMPIILSLSFAFVLFGWSFSLEKTIMSSALFVIFFLLLTFNDLKKLANNIDIKF